MLLDILIYILYSILILGVASVILADDGDSGRKLAWLLIIVLIPAVGLILYIALGINYRRHWYFNKRHQKSIEIFRNETTEELNKALFGSKYEDRLKDYYRPLARLLANFGRPNVGKADEIEVITYGKRKYELLMDDIRNAKEYIHMEYFHFGNDDSSNEVKHLLMKKASEGVKVRFIYENIANFPIRSKYYNSMKKSGVEVLKFTNPRLHLLNLVTNLNYRNHRKIVIIDGKIGYTGGMNINNHYFRQWRDTHLRIVGPVVGSLQLTFLDSWITAGGILDKPLTYFFPCTKAKDDCNTASPSESIDYEAIIKLDSPQRILRDKLVQIVPDEPQSQWPIIQMSYEWALHNARKYIFLQTPYFVPSEPLLNALKSASLRGVDVRLMLPEKPDNFLLRPANRSYFEECLDAGIKIYLRGGEFIHSKTFVSDDYLSCIGTANLDFRSFEINYEVNTMIYDSETALMNKQIFEEDMKKSYEITLEMWKSRPWYSHIFERVVRLLSPLL